MNESFFIPSYPPLTDNLFSYKIFRKKEFNDYRLGTEEIVPRTPGVPLMHQELIRRFFSPNTPYVDCLIYHYVGTGKTCEVSFIVEGFRHYLLNNKTRKPALILVRNVEQVTKFYDEIERVCTYHQYFIPESQVKEEELTPKMVESRVKSMMRKNYDIKTITSFAASISGWSPQRLKETFSNRILIIDEAHHLRKTAKQIYPVIHRLFHSVEGCHKLLLTGTPIWDSVDEIATLMNLILSDDDQLPTGKEFIGKYFENDKLIPKKANKLRELFKYKISFLRPMMSTARKDYMGARPQPDLPWLEKTIVFPDGMSKLQTDITNSIAEKEAQKGEKHLYISSRNAAILVLPAKEKDKDKPNYELYREYIHGKEEKTVQLVRGKGEPKKTRIFKKKQMDPEIMAKLTGPLTVKKTVTEGGKQIVKEEHKKASIEMLSLYSAKNASIIQNIIDHPRELFFIYNEFVKGTGGSVVFGLLLERFGFKWIRTQSQINSMSPIIAGKRVSRFVIISSKKHTLHGKAINDFLSKFNRPTNKYGDYCQIIIGSRKMGEAFTFKNIRQCHIVGAPWQSSSIEQAIGRTFRTGSHSDLTEKEERILKVYQHVSVEKDNSVNGIRKGEGYPSSTAFSRRDSIDIYIYKILERKDRFNVQIYRLLKEVAWDCPLNYKRNVLESDVPYSKECDFEECNYQCYGFPVDNINKEEKVWDYRLGETETERTRTFELLYSDDIVRSHKKIIRMMYRRESSYIFADIFHQCTLRTLYSTRYIVLTALREIINNRTLLRNRLGFSCYLKEKNNVYYLDLDVTGEMDAISSSYVSKPIITERTSLKGISEIVRLKSDKKLVCDFASKDDASILSKLSQPTLTLLLEQSFKLQRLNPTQHAKSVFDSVMKRMGSRLVKMSDGNTVHTLSTPESEATGIAYGEQSRILSASGQLRVFSENTGEWGYPDRKTEESYISQLTTKRKERTKTELEIDKRYGILGMLVPQLKGEPKFKVKIRSGVISEREGTGIACSSLTYQQHANIHDMPEIDYAPLGVPSVTKTREKLIKSITKLNKDITQFSEDKLEGYTDDKLRKIYTFLRFSRTELCEVLERWLKENNQYVVEY